MVVGIPGILKAGGAYVPIDPDSPGRSSRYIVTNTGTKLILTQRALLKNCQLPMLMRLCLDDPHALDGFPKTTHRPPAALPTWPMSSPSGSLSRPKAS